MRENIQTKFSFERSLPNQKLNIWSNMVNLDLRNISNFKCYFKTHKSSVCFEVYNTHAENFSTVVE